MDEDTRLTLKGAAELLGLSPRTVSKIIKSGALFGRRSDGKGGKYMILKSACIDYLRNPQARGGDDTFKGGKRCHSYSEGEYGTAISLPRQAKELGDRLVQRTRSKQRSCMTV
ncbi:helix-turn-helix domain-containing protein [Candidatus Fukatsuia symbiotica]|uniref:Helix-turn-helix domain-containing protein n=1 Tax=Candidatus Fukatsuia symbiotica TaxID=1878942 RepID=A0A2U8I4U9_9GAMM|nr:helix-turn-helix domain-containing protein [Candidatus Fukatsuia symbiotica]AWK14181.1 hypothetical protein CCS41_06290 [Candidatus Fukatsuia symbiotica]MEA9446281.1 helix-turn-helix domain-containing protein [Candidatus Fukatsuia symbiotica]